MDGRTVKTWQATYIAAAATGSAADTMTLSYLADSTGSTTGTITVSDSLYAPIPSHPSSQTT